MSDSFMSTQQLLEHWQGHRSLTRRVIEAFPDDQLFTYSIGGMRTFGDLSMELVTMAAPMVRGVLTGTWDNPSRDVKEKSRILQLWDESTDEMNRLWPQIPASRFTETLNAFGSFPGPAHALILYVIDNEIHHRGQGYVYLRSMGISPPAFYER